MLCEFEKFFFLPFVKSDGEGWRELLDPCVGRPVSVLVVEPDRFKRDGVAVDVNRVAVDNFASVNCPVPLDYILATEPDDFEYPMPSRVCCPSYLTSSGFHLRTSN